MIAALLLDLDGTLVDSEPLHVAAHRAFLPTVGMDISDDELAQNVGRGDAQMYRELIARHGIAGADAEVWVQRKTDALIRIYERDGLRLMPGARELLAHAFDAGVACMIVSSSERRLVRAALAATSLEQRLPMRVCRDDVVHHKPHPEPYLLAASRLGLAPACCLAVEDSATGVASARAAGMPVAAIPSAFMPAARLAEAGARVVPSLAALIPLKRLLHAG